MIFVPLLVVSLIFLKIYLVIPSPEKKSFLADDNNTNNNKEIIQGKRINFNEEVSNLNLIQNRKNSNFYKSALKEETKSAFFLSPTKANINDNEINNINEQPETGQIQNKINIPPNNQVSSLISNNNNINNKNIENNKILNGTKTDINIMNNKNIVETNNINYVLKNVKKIVCTCTRTQCQKKYCACFSSGNYCQGCDCKGCLNIKRDNNNNIIQEGEKIYDNQKDKEINIQNNLCQENKAQAIVCNCTKSRCMKKYCECYKMNIDCGNLCRCIDCQNKNNQNIYSNISLNNNRNNIIENKNTINEIQNDNIEKLKEISKSFSINAMGIHIHNKQMLIQERNIDLNIHKINLNTTPKLTNKKRSRGKNENSNLKTCPTTVSSSRRKKKGYSQVNTNVKSKKLVMG